MTWHACLKCLCASANWLGHHRHDESGNWLGHHKHNWTSQIRSSNRNKVFLKNCKGWPYFLLYFNFSEACHLFLWWVRIPETWKKCVNFVFMNDTQHTRISDHCISIHNKWIKVSKHNNKQIVNAGTRNIWILIFGLVICAWQNHQACSWLFHKPVETSHLRLQHEQPFINKSLLRYSSRLYEILMVCNNWILT